MQTQKLADAFTVLLATLLILANASSPHVLAAEPPAGPGPARFGARLGIPPIDIPFLNRRLPRRAEEAKREEARKSQAKTSNANEPNAISTNANQTDTKPSQLARNLNSLSKSKPNLAVTPPIKVSQISPVPVVASSKTSLSSFPENVETPENEGQPAPAKAPAPPRDPGIFSVLVSEKNPATSEWKPLFNGKDLTSWQSSKFGGDGEISVVDAAIVLGVGGDMTGITYTGEVPKMNYALEVEAQRREGSDFFAGITFPVAESHVTLIPGGWGGGVFGISCINFNDASENETTKPMTFDDKKWYTFRIQVTEGRIQVWVDQKPEIDLNTTDKKLTTRGEVESSKPLGISTWRTSGAIRSIKLRSLTPQEILAAAKK